MGGCSRGGYRRAVVLRVRVPGLVLRVSGFGFRVSGAGFRVSGFGYKARKRAEESVCYRVTSLIRNCLLLGPYSRTMPRVLWWSWGGGGFL